MVARLTATSNVNPTSGTTYTANTTFGSGTGSAITGAGNFVVYVGVGTTANITGLTGGTSYTFTVYEYNTTGMCYKTPGSSSAVTTAAPPSGFSDCYTPTNWSLSGGNGSVNTTSAPTSIAFTGPTTGGATTLYQITVPTTGTIGFNWSTTHADPGWATFGYKVNSTFTALTSGAASGTISSVSVTAGDVFAFYGTANSGNIGTFVATISNFTRSCPASCTAPTSQATIGAYTNNVSPGTSLTVNWSRGTPSPGNGVVVVARLTATSNVDPTSGTTYTANTTFGSGTGSAITGTGNFVVYVGTGTTANITGLTAGTSYTFTVYEYNTTGTCYKTPGSSSAVTTYAPPTYCTPSTSIPCAANYDMIDAVQFGSGGSVYNGSSTGCTSGGYNNLTAVTINFTQGVTYPFSITTSAVFNNSLDNCALWIDFNDDGDFVDAGEFLVNVSASANIFSGNIAISASAATGNHRMRIRGAYSTAFASGNTSCESQTYGEAQDYTVNISTACTQPTSQATIGSYTNNVSPGTSLTVNWSRGTPSPGNGVVVVARLTATSNVDPTSGTTYTANTTFGSGTGSAITGTGNFVVYVGTGTTANITGLTAGTSYTFTVYEYNTTGMCYKIAGSSSAVTTFIASCTPPNGTVSFGSFSGVTSSATTTNVTYTNGGNAATGYVVLRNTSTTPPTAPASGTAVPAAGSTTFVSGYTVVNTTTTLGSSVAFNSTSLTASTPYYYWVVAYQNLNGPCWFTPGTQTSNSQTTACAAPSAPATPTGTQTVCSGTQYTYNVTAVAGATSYDWTLPSGWTATSLNTATNSITATAGSSGNISVRVNTCGGSSSYSGNLAITVTTSPTISFPSGQTVSMGCSIPITLNPSGASISASGGVGVSTSGGVNSLAATFEMASSVQITSGACSSPVYTISVTAGVSNRGTLASGDQTICDGQTPNSIAYSSAATGTGITYQWYYKNTNATCPTTNEATTGWTIISGAQSSTHSPAQGFVPTGSTYTFACYVGSSSGTGGCGGWSSGCRKITVSNVSVGGTIAGSATVCTGTNSTGLTLSGHTGAITNWESSLDNFATAGTPIANTTTTLTATSLSATTSYRAVITSGACAAVNSATATVTVSPASVGGTAAATASTICSGSSTTVSVSGHTGTIQWQQSADGSTGWTTVSGGSGGTTATYTTPNLTSTTSYRAVITSGACATVNSATATVTVNTNNLWMGTNNEDWNTAANWSCGVVPASGANIVFSPSAVNDLSLDQNRSVGNIDFNGSSENIVLGAFNLTISGAISNYSANNYVKSTGAGNLTTTIANGVTFIFPIGKTSYNPLSIKNTTGATDVFSVRVQDAVYANGASGATISTPHVSRTWDISKTNANAGTGVDLIFNWNPSDVSGILANPRMNHHTGSFWEIPISTIASSNAGSNTYTVNGYTGTFSPFSIGEGASPLPVELVSFQANCTEQGVALRWQTASEHSSAYFEIERSADGQNWNQIGQVEAAGNSTSLLNYSIIDSEIERTVMYYRLHQVDFDGVNKLYNPISVLCADLENTISTYPNPSSDEGFQLLIGNSLGARTVNLNIVDVEGKLIYTKKLQLQKGSNVFNMYDFKSESGVYFLQIKDDDGVTSIIKHVHF